jgi:hypothetical protein
MTVTMTCAHCGAHPDERAPDRAMAILMWTSSRQDGRESRFCPNCSRENLRSIESGIDEQYW